MRLAIFLYYVAACGNAFFGVPQSTHSASRPNIAATTTLMVVSKGELVDAIAARAGVSKKMAGVVLTSGLSYRSNSPSSALNSTLRPAALDVIVESVANGDKVIV
jgi:hypothetical protein